jgi:hypothetical protein
MPVHEALKYILGAYLVFAVLLVTYGAIMVRRRARVRQEIRSLRNLLEGRER